MIIFIPEQIGLVGAQDVADLVHIGEEVILVNPHVLGHHLINQPGCHRFPDNSRTAHRSRSVKLSSANEKMKTKNTNSLPTLTLWSMGDFPDSYNPY